jgi:hypothetical protein
MNARLAAVAEDCGCKNKENPIQEAEEGGLVWKTRHDGVWHAQGTGGTYYMTPTPSGQVRVMWMGSDGDQKDLGAHSFASGAQVAARFIPSSGRMAAEATEPTPATEDVCRPWVRMEKDPQAFDACMKLADKLGPINGHDKLYEVVRQQMQREDVEVFYAIVIDTHCNLRAMSEISRGSRDRVPTPVPDLARMAAYQAIHYGGQGLGVAHCHPSGKPKPSKADGEVTKAVESLCDALGIMFVDHLVIGAPSEGYYSFRKKRIYK